MDDKDTSWMTFPNTDEAKTAYIVRSKEEMRRYLRSLTWEQKVDSIQRMNEFGKRAREAMREAMEAEKAQTEGVS